MLRGVDIRAGTQADPYLGSGPARTRRILMAMLAISAPLVLTGLLCKGQLAGAYFLSNLHSLYHAFALRGADSWVPMLTARAWLAQHPYQDVYQAVFFDQGVKFQYPVSSLLFIDWLRPDGDAAIRILNEINGVFLAATIGGMVLLTRALADRAGIRRTGSDRIWLAAVAATGTFCFYPLLRGASIGQMQVVIDALFVFACYTYLLGGSAASGFLIGLSTLIKPQLGLFILWGLLRRDVRFSAGMMVALLAGFAGTALLHGASWPLGYLKVLSYIAAHGESFFPNQSVNGLVHRWLEDGNNLEWEGSHFAPYNPVAYAATLASSLVLLAAGLLFGRHSSPARSVAPMMIAGICFTMASPVVWEHHYGMLLPAFSFCLVSLLAAPGGGSRVCWALLGTTYICAGNSLPMTNFWSRPPFNLVQSYLFFAALGVLGLTWRLARQSGRPVTSLPASNTRPLGMTESQTA